MLSILSTLLIPIMHVPCLLPQWMKYPPNCPPDSNLIVHRKCRGPQPGTKQRCWSSNKEGQFISVQSLSHVQLCDSLDCSMPGLPVHHQLLEFTQTHVHWLMSMSVMPSSHLILCRPCLLLPSIFPSIRVFSNNKTDGCELWPESNQILFMFSKLI